MFTVRPITLALGLVVCGRSSFAQMVVNSTFLNRPTQPGVYSDPTNWAPAEVPNDTPTKHFNVTISPSYFVDVDVDATISNLTLTSSFPGLNIAGKSLRVTGATTNQMQGGHIYIESNSDAAAKFDAGTLSTFSNSTLSGYYDIYSFDNPATLQFKGANIGILANATVTLWGSLAEIVDESGNDALSNLERIDSTSRLQLNDRSVVTNAPFRNDGDLSLSFGATPTTFTAAAGLTNFDLTTRTITGGAFHLSGSTTPGSLVELRFNGADIVNLASSIVLSGINSNVVDLAGEDGLRNLGRILPGGILSLDRHDFAATGQFRNDGSLSLLLDSIFTIAAGLTNFDASTRTLSGGTFWVGTGSQLKFADADIVHNNGSITLEGDGIITDMAGNDALRNFSNNLSSGGFTVGHSSVFTAPGDFTNAGQIESFPTLFTLHDYLHEGRFIVPPGFRYTQTAGLTVNNGFLLADEIDIVGGSFSGRGTVKGNMTVTNATFVPSAAVTIQGKLTLGLGSHFRYQLHSDPLNEISGQVSLAGILDVDLPSDAFVSSTAFLTMLKSAVPLTGTFSNAPNGARIPTVDGQGSVVVIYDSKAVYVTQYHAEPPPSQLLNISARAFLSRSDDDPFGDRAVLIGGFIVSGTSAKEVVLRGLGPFLADYGLGSVLANPLLELHASNGSLLASNDDWRQTQASEIMASGLAPNDDREAAVRITLQPGTYTVVLKEKNGLAGVGLVEIYDLSQNSSSKLANISTRGYTDSSNVLIGGIIVAGPGQANAEIVVRAIGPQLRDYGILNALADPTLELRDANGSVVAFNDDCSTNLDQVASTGLFPRYNAESAMRLSLPRGNYTAIVRAKANASGVALAEFYDLRR